MKTQITHLGTNTIVKEFDHFASKEEITAWVESLGQRIVNNHFAFSGLRLFGPSYNTQYVFAVEYDAYYSVKYLP